MCSLQENQVFRLIVNKIKFRRYRTRLGRGGIGPGLEGEQEMTETLHIGLFHFYNPGV